MFNADGVYFTELGKLRGRVTTFIAEAAALVDSDPKRGFRGIKEQLLWLRKLRDHVQACEVALREWDSSSQSTSVNKWEKGFNSVFQAVRALVAHYRTYDLKVYNRERDGDPDGTETY